VRYLGDAAREGVGAPDFERAPGLAAAQPMGAAAPASAGLAPAGWMGDGLAPMSRPIAGTFVNPALLQRLTELRAAGLI
jgi:subtilisin